MANHLNSANILTQVNLSTTSAFPSLSMTREGDPRTWAVGKYARKGTEEVRGGRYGGGSCTF